MVTKSIYFREFFYIVNNVDILQLFGGEISSVFKISETELEWKWQSKINFLKNLLMYHVHEVLGYLEVQNLILESVH